MPTRKLRGIGKKASSPSRQHKPGASMPPSKDPLPVQKFAKTPNPQFVSHERGAAAMWQSGTL